MLNNYCLETFNHFIFVNYRSAIKVAKEAQLQAARTAFETFLTKNEQFTSTSSFIACQESCVSLQFWRLIPEQSRMETFYKHNNKLAQNELIQVKMELTRSQLSQFQTDIYLSQTSKFFQLGYRMQTKENYLMKNIEDLTVQLNEKSEKIAKLKKDLKVSKIQPNDYVDLTFDEDSDQSVVHQIKCSDCGNGYEHEWQLRFHMQFKHGSVDDNYECDHCAAQFVTKFSLIEHIRSHLPIISCTICHKTFEMVNDLIKHLTIHREIKNVECSHCDKSFLTKTHLRYHIVGKHFVIMNCEFEHCSFKSGCKVNYEKHIMKMHMNADKVKLKELLERVQKLKPDYNHLKYV